MSLFTLVLYPDHLIYKAHSPHQVPLYVHSATNSEVNTWLEELSNLPCRPAPASWPMRHLQATNGLSVTLSRFLVYLANGLRPWEQHHLSSSHQYKEKLFTDWWACGEMTYCCTVKIFDYILQITNKVSYLDHTHCILNPKLQGISHINGNYRCLNIKNYKPTD